MVLIILVFRISVSWLHPNSCYPCSQTVLWFWNSSYTTEMVASIINIKILNIRIMETEFEIWLESNWKYDINCHLLIATWYGWSNYFCRKNKPINCKSIFTIISILSDHLWHNYQSYENIILLSNNRNNASLGNHGNWNNGWHASGNNQMFLIARENEIWTYVSTPYSSAITDANRPWSVP